jgi:hypothetical protein
MSTAEHLLSIDPGGTIGYSRYLIKPEPVLLEVEGWGETADHQQFLNLVWSQLAEKQLQFVVIEDFVPRPGVRTWQPAAIHQIGAVLWMCRKNHVKFAVQQVGDVTRFSTDSKIDPFQHGPNGIKGMRGHAIMSLRHAVYYRYINYPRA